MATSMLLDEARAARMAAGARMEQAELEDEEDGDRVYTPEDEYAAGEALLAAQAFYDRAKEEAKQAKAEMDDAAAEWRRVHRRVRLAREAGQW